jgi:PST family polysaccharide transporter
MELTPFLQDGSGKRARRSVRATVATTAAAGLDFAVRLGSVAVLARLVSPSDFGVVMTAGAAVAVAEQFRDLGLSTATMQRPDLSEREVTNLFWINAGAGTLLAILLCALSPLLAALLGDPRLVPVTCALSLTLPAGGLAVQHQALLGRSLRLGRLAAVRFGAGLAATALAVWLALRGAGCWALLWREVARAALLTAGTWCLLPWRPGPPRDLAGVLPHLRFGADVLGSNLLGAIAGACDRLILGGFAGPAAVGVYRQAAQLVATPTDQLLGPLYQVAQPALSRVQHEPERYRRAYARLLTLVSVVTMPVSLFLAVFAGEATLVLLGPGWTEAVPVVRILCIAAVFRQPVGSTALILMTRGDARACLRLAALNQLLLVPAMFIGARGGPRGIAFAEVTVAVLMITPRLRSACRASPVGRSLVLSTLARPLIAAGLMTLVLLAAAPALGRLDVPARLAAAAALAITAFAAAWLVLPGGRAFAADLAADLRSALRPASPAAAAA